MTARSGKCTRAPKTAFCLTGRPEEPSRLRPDARGVPTARNVTHSVRHALTHNANLVVNTDADQVIVATCGPHRPSQLAVISYESGGLENHRIRKHICDILEGGERAFKERARRLRVVL
jgi:hypothetical protein